MTRKHPIQRLVELLSGERREVVIVGDISRTCYEDIFDIECVVQFLGELGAEIRCGTQMPFDSYIMEAAVAFDVPCTPFGPMDWSTRLVTRSREKWVLESAAAVVAFAREGDDDPISADREICVEALALELPLLVVRRGHNFKWITMENYAYAG